MECTDCNHAPNPQFWRSTRSYSGGIRGYDDYWTLCFRGDAWVPRCSRFHISTSTVPHRPFCLPWVIEPTWPIRKWPNTADGLYRDWRAETESTKRSYSVSSLSCVRRDCISLGLLHRTEPGSKTFGWSAPRRQRVSSRWIPACDRVFVAVWWQSVCWCNEVFLLRT